MLCLTRNSFIPKDKSHVIIQDSTLSIQQGRSSSTPDFVQNSGAFNNCKQNYKSPTIDRLIQWPGQGTYCKFCGALSFHFRPFHVCFDTIFQQYVTAYGNCPCLTRPTMQHFMKSVKVLESHKAIFRRPVIVFIHNYNIYIYKNNFDQIVHIVNIFFGESVYPRTVKSAAPSDRPKTSYYDFNDLGEI